MSHINHSILRTTSKENGDPINIVLGLYDNKTPRNKKFGKQLSFSQDGKAINIDCGCRMIFSDRVAIEPRLDEYRFTSDDIPSYLTLGCENTSEEDAQTIVGTQGPSGVVWSPISEGIE